MTGVAPRRIFRLTPEASRRVAVILAAAAIAGCRGAAPLAPVEIVRPGAPGAQARTISAAEATDLSAVSYTPADVRFMQRMMTHHAQAVEMVALIAARTAREDIRILGRRIAASQTDEMDLMRQWLVARRQEVPSEHAHHMDHTTTMPGMLTAEAMTRLAAAQGEAFDRLFLEGMIRHHAGALVMVDELFAAPGAGQEVEIFTFSSDVEADQRMEIGRMGTMLEAMMKEGQQ